MNAAILGILVGCGPSSGLSSGTRPTPTDTGTATPPTTTPPTPPPPTVPSTLELGPERACADPTRRDAAEFDHDDMPSPPNGDLWIWSGGTITLDVDGDADLDVVRVTEVGAQLLEGDGHGAFTLDALPFGALDTTMGTGGSTADYDGDGDLDLLITRFDAPIVLLRNDGGGTFTGVSTQAFPAEAVTVDPEAIPPTTVSPRDPLKAMTSSWADLDHDGDLDLYVGGYGYVDETGTPTEDFAPADPNLLLLNDGDGTFTNASDALPPRVHHGYDYAGGFFDVTGDGWADLVTINDFGAAFPNAMLVNDHGTLVDDGDLLNGLDGLVVTGMGLAWGDINGDGLGDLGISEWNKFKLLASLGDLWIDTALAKDLIPDGGRDQKVAWGLEFGDMDNDGDLDLPVAFGFVANENPAWTNPFDQPDALYLTQADGSVQDEGTAWGVADAGVSRGFALADFNADGWLDLVKRDLNGPDRLHMSRCGDEAFLEIHLVDEASPNRFAVGATVVVTTPAGDATRRWIVAGGSNFASGGPPVAYVGLGDNDTVDLTITWPDGATSTQLDVPTRRTVTVRR